MEFKLIHEEVISEGELNTGGVAPQDVVFSPMDIWVDLALHLDTSEIARLKIIVGKAIDRLQWKIDYLPSRWVHVKEGNEKKLNYWHSLESKLNSLCHALDPIQH